MDYNPNMVLSTVEFDVVGTRPIRHDGLDKVTGRARYAADAQVTGALYGKILRSPHAHARIRSINTSKAEALPGVKAVVTAADLPDLSNDISDQTAGAMVNYGFFTRNILAVEKALYKGHAIAAVAATSVHVAEEALALIEVDYEVLKPVLNDAEATAPGAPVLHEGLVTISDQAYRSGGIDASNAGSNIASHFSYSTGDLEKGFAEADAIVEHEFRTKAVHQGYIEPHSATALWNKNGTLTIWTSTQQLFGLRDHMAVVLKLPVSNVKIIPMEIGGGFGGKGVGGCYLEPVAAVLSRKVGEAVKMTMSRTEVFVGSGPTSAATMKAKIGATKDGKITAAEAELIYEAGAFPGSPVPSGLRTMFGPYDIENVAVDGYDVVVNTQKTAAYRAPGSPAASFAAETVMDELAEKLGIDPVDFRLANAAKEGTRQAAGPVFGKIGCIEVLEALKDHPHYNTPLEGENQGRGVALGFWFNGSGPATAVASVNADGTVGLVGGAPDIGGTRVAMAMQVAEVLGIAAEDVTPSVGDTDSIGYSSGAGGSSVAFKMGTACYEAAQDVRHQIIQRAARIWDVDPESVEYDKGTVRHQSDPELKMTFAQIAARLNATGGPITGRAAVNPTTVGNAFCANIVDVEVDPETGKTQVLRITTIQDVGKALHPSYVEGQIQGGTVQGIGWALNEEYYLDKEGQMVNSSFLDYRMPTALDLPMIDTVVVEVTNPGHPFGVRGVGEVTLIPPMAAIANAIHNAVGTRLTNLPMTPGVVLESLGVK